MSSVSLRIATPLGTLELCAHDVASTAELSLSVAPFMPELPEGMSVAACYGALLQIHSSQSAIDVHWQAKLHATVPLNHGGPNRGQGLEAQDWSGQQHVLLVGTEDAEYLQERLGKHIVVSNYSFVYSPDTFSVRVTGSPTTNSLSVHFIIAWAEDTEEQGGNSCWFAVDQPHTAVVIAIGP